MTFLWCGSDWRTDPNFVAAAKGLPPGTLHDVSLWIAEHLPIFPNAGEGLWYQIQHNFRGHGSYVLGHWHARAVWYYFPLALTMKLTLPVLLLLGATLIVKPHLLASSRLASFDALAFHH